MTYDGLGRLRTRKDYRSDLTGCGGTAAGAPAASAEWRYDGSPGGLGRVASVTDSVTGFHRVLTYDRLGRLEMTETRPGTGNGRHFEKTTYDAHGRVFQVFDATRERADFTDNGVRYAYNANGYLEKLQDAVGTKDSTGTFTPRRVYRTITAVDARGNLTAERLGNGITRHRSFDGRTGRVRAINAGRITPADRQRLTYEWDALGNLSERARTRNRTTLTEEFCHDGLNRLTRTRRSSGSSQRTAKLCSNPLSQLTGIETVSYDAYGNIRTKSGVGTYAYGAGTAGPHAVTSVTGPDNARVTYVYDANGNNTTSSDGRRIRYTTFDKPESVVKGNHTTTFAYGPDRARLKRTDTDARGTTTTLYLGSVEKITHPDRSQRIKRHIGGIVIETLGAGTDTREIRYVLRDHLGSVDTLTDTVGNEVQTMSFDAWGRRRNAETWATLAAARAAAFDTGTTRRGFTGHEMLDPVGLVHMNGRVYDPALGRFLQADRFVQFPGNTQGHNRYSYVMNNPLAYTDPTGHFLRKLFRPLASIAVSIWLPGAGFWTGSTLFAANGFGAVAVSGFVAGAVASGNLEGAALGAFSAAAFFGIGSLFEGAFGATSGAGALGSGMTGIGLTLKSGLHGATGGLMSVLRGGRFGHGFLSAFAIQLGAGPIAGLARGSQRVVASAVLGGTVSAARCRRRPGASSPTGQSPARSQGRSTRRCTVQTSTRWATRRWWIGWCRMRARLELKYRKGGRLEQNTSMQ